MVFFSRYFIHEMLLVFFTLLVVAAAWRYLQSRHWKWAVLTGLGLGLMHATKETCVLNFAAMTLSLGLCSPGTAAAGRSRPASASAGHRRVMLRWSWRWLWGFP